MKAKRGVALLAGLALMLLSVSISQTGCFAGYPIRPVADSLFGILGKAYEWVNPPPDTYGAVFYKNDDRPGWEILDEMEKDAFQKYELVPLEGVEVGAGMRDPYDALAVIRATSDAEGLFMGGTVGQSWAGHWVLKFSKSGYIEVTLELQQEALNYALVVIMVKEDSPSQTD